MGPWDKARTPRKWLAAAAAAVLAMALVLAIEPSTFGAFVPDTAGYLAFDPIRQPAYGHWAHAVHSMTGSWTAVGAAQCLLFLGACAWYLHELWMTGRGGPLMAALCACGLFVLLKIHVGSLIGALVPEGLFFATLTALAAAALRCARAGFGHGKIVVATLLLLLATQLRPAAAATLLILPAAVLALLLVRSRPDLTRRAWTVVLATAFFAAVLPWASGKRPFQVGTPADALGFALLPRVAQLPAEGLGPDAPPLWRELAASWQARTRGMDITEAALFDAEIQEAVRFYLAPKILFPQRRFSWSSETDRQAARSLALKWISAQPLAYAGWCSRHFIATLTAAPFADARQRQRVWAAVHDVDPRVWQMAVFNAEYPNNHFDRPLKPSTAWLYAAIRIAAGLAAVGGAALFVLAAIRVMRRRPVAPALAIGAAGWAWVALHAVAVAITVFPEWRFVMLTLWGYALFGFAAAGAAFAQLGAKERA